MARASVVTQFNVMSLTVLEIKQNLDVAITHSEIHVSLRSIAVSRSVLEKMTCQCRDVILRCNEWFMSNDGKREGSAYFRISRSIGMCMQMYSEAEDHQPSNTQRPPFPPFICCFDTFGAVVGLGRPAG